MAGIAIKNPTTVATVGSTVGTTAFAADCIEVVLRARKTNTHAVHLNIQNADAGDVNPTSTGGNAITLEPTESVILPVHGNAQVAYIRDSGASTDQKLEVTQVLQA